MRVSNQPWSERILKGLVIPVFLIAAAIRPGHARDVSAVMDDAIIVRARDAREAEDGSAMFLSGGLEVRAPEWRIDAESAELFGPLEDLERIVADGERAVIAVTRRDGGEPFHGSSRHIEFEPASDVVKLRGEAEIVKGRQSIHSESIDYMLKDATFSAGEGGRVRVVTKPEAKGR